MKEKSLYDASLECDFEVNFRQPARVVFVGNELLLHKNIFSKRQAPKRFRCGLGLYPAVFRCVR